LCSDLAGAGALRDLSVFSSIRFVAMSLPAHLTPLDLGAVFGQLAGLVRMLGWLFALPMVAYLLLLLEGRHIEGSSRLVNEPSSP
jgi:hypothetical protein